MSPRDTVGPLLRAAGVFPPLKTPLAISRQCLISEMGEGFLHECGLSPQLCHTILKALGMSLSLAMSGKHLIIRPPWLSGWLAVVAR